MYKVLFVCHGNICRSSAAEYIFKSLIKENHLESSFCCASRATSREEIGNDIYPPMKRVLINHKIEIEKHYASQITKKDYDDYDLILLMDEENMYGIRRIIPYDLNNRIYLLKDYVGLTGEIEDPWYTGRYEQVYQEIYECLERLIAKLRYETKLK